MGPKREAIMKSTMAISMFVVCGALACSTQDIINIGGSDDLGGDRGPTPAKVSLPCAVLASDGDNYYVAQKTRTLPWPVENLVGIASDQTGLWLLDAIWNTGNVRFVHYDLSTGEVTEPLWVLGLFDAPGTGASGLEVDAQFFWVTLIGNDNAILRIDRTTLEIVRLPGLEVGGSSDLAWLGDELLVTTTTGWIYALAPSTWNRRFYTSAPGAIREFSIATCGNTTVAAAGYGVLSLLGPTPEESGSAGLIGSDAGDLYANPSMAGPLCFHGDELVVANSSGIEFFSLALRPVQPF
jgi:hypothetical protein